MDKVVLSFTPSLLYFTLSLSLSHYLSPPFDLKFRLLHAIFGLCLFVLSFCLYLYSDLRKRKAGLLRYNIPP